MILLFKGFVLGFIFSVTMVAGTVWCVQVTKRHGTRSGLGAALGITVGQSAWITLGVILVFAINLLPLQHEIEPALRLFAIAVLLYMAMKLLRAPRAESLDCPETDGDVASIFRSTFAISLGMSMRLFGYIALCIAAGLSHHGLALVHSPVIVIVGTVLGTCGWWLYIVYLARIFARKVPEAVILRSINKLSRFGACVYLLIAVITAAPLVLTT